MKTYNTSALLKHVLTRRSMQKLMAGSGLGDRHHHKFRRYRFDGKEYKEEPGMLAMRLCDFFKYITQRETAQKEKENNKDGILKPDVVIEARKKDKSVIPIDPNTDVLYMLDLDMPRQLPQLDTSLHSEFKVPHVLPGGAWCSLNQVSGNPVRSIS